MDDEATQWMIEALEEHLGALQDNSNEAYSDRLLGLAVSAKIIRRVLPDEDVDFDPSEPNWQWQVEIAVTKALGVLRRQSEVTKYLGTVGPALPAERLHPVIWDNAAALWDGGHYGAALSRAATFLSAHIRDKSQRADLSDRKLVQQVFSTAPPAPDAPRLRWVGDVPSETRTAMREGILNFAQGVFLAIRNPATHGTHEIAPQVALEQLAALSTLARWVDQCQREAVDD